MLALLTNGGNTSTPMWNVQGTNYSAHEALVDVLTCTSLKADAHGGLSVNGSGGMPQVGKAISERVTPNYALITPS